MYKGACLYWSSRLATVVATSSTEAELLALYYGLREGQYVREILIELDVVDRATPVPLNDDSNACIANASSSVALFKKKHLDSKLLKTYELIHKDKIFLLRYQPTKDMLADFFTKILGPTQFETLRDRIMGLDRLPLTPIYDKLQRWTWETRR
eukprot:g3759.t1